MVNLFADKPLTRSGEVTRRGSTAQAASYASDEHTDGKPAEDEYPHLLRSSSAHQRPSSEPLEALGHPLRSCRWISAPRQAPSTPGREQPGDYQLQHHLVCARRISGAGFNRVSNPSRGRSSARQSACFASRKSWVQVPSSPRPIPTELEPDVEYVRMRRQRSRVRFLGFRFAFVCCGIP